MIHIPENLKSSKGDGSVSRTLKGLTGVLVFLIVSYTPIVEADAILLVNSLLLIVSVAYSLVGLLKKYHNRFNEDKL